METINTGGGGQAPQHPASKLENIVSWLAYIDIYGFGVGLTEVELQNVSERLLKLHDYIEKTITNAGKFNVYMLSDSVVLFCADGESRSSKSLSTLTNFLIQIQNEALKLDFVFRGSIAHGEITFGGRVCLGPPLLRAVRLESDLAIPLVILPERELDRVKDIFPIETTGPLLVPTKKGSILGTPILPAPLDEFREHTLVRLKKSGTYGPDHVAKVWADLHQFLETLPKIE